MLSEYAPASGVGSRVGQGDCSPQPPSDPDVRDTRIRLLRNMVSLRDARWSGPPPPSAGDSVPRVGRTDPMACAFPASVG